MQARNIDLRVLTQKIDTSTPEGRLFFHMTAAFDEFQRELIVENTRAGLAAASRQGRRGGRPRALDDGKIRLLSLFLAGTNPGTKARTCMKRSIHNQTRQWNDTYLCWVMAR